MAQLNDFVMNKKIRNEIDIASFLKKKKAWKKKDGFIKKKNGFLTFVVVVVVTQQYSTDNIPPIDRSRYKIIELPNLR